MYQTTSIILKNKDVTLNNYCDNFTRLAKNFKNSVIFRCRQLLSAKNKNYQNLSSNEKQVLAEFKITEDKYNSISDKYYLPSFYHFDYMFKKNKNVDYYNDLPTQTTQNIIKECLSDFKAFFKGVKSYNQNKDNFTGRPKLPRYIKQNKASFDITNQDAVIKNGVLKLPKIKAKLSLGNLILAKLKEVTIKPFYNTYKIYIVTEQEELDTNFNLDYSKILGIDIGVNNFITTNNNFGLTPFIVNGKIMKSYNQYYNKRIALLKSLLSKSSKKKLYCSDKIDRLNKKRANYFTDKMHKISTYVINYCLDNDIGTVVVGKNSSWKQNSNINKVNNQNFCYIPHNLFINKLKEKAIKYSINVIEREESYTSKCSFLDNDFIYTYGKDDKSPFFSGKRKHRGLYISKGGVKLNADVNGAANIIKKEFQNAFDNIKDFSYMYKTVEKINII